MKSKILNYIEIFLLKGVFIININPVHRPQTYKATPLPQLHVRIIHSSGYVYGGNQGWLSGTFTEVQQRRPMLVLGWVTVREDRAL